jgi:hypothetical protein
LAILGQKTLDWFGNTFPIQKQKILPLFVSKGQRINRVEKLQPNIVPKSKGKRKL